jgi:hypothetical protein
MKKIFRYGNNHIDANWLRPAGLVKPKKETEVGKQLNWRPYWLQRRWWRGPVQVRFGASDQSYDLRIKLNGKHWHLVVDGNPLTNDVLPAYEETKYSGSVTTVDGKKISVLAIGIEPVELAPDQPANPTKDTPAFIQTVDEGEARVLDEQPEFRKLEFRGGKLNGAWYFRLEEAGSQIGEFGRSEGPEVKVKHGAIIELKGLKSVRNTKQPDTIFLLPNCMRRKSMATSDALEFVYACQGCKGEVASDGPLEIALCHTCAKALAWQKYLLQRHKDPTGEHYDLRVGEDLTLKLSGTLLDNTPDEAEVSKESAELKGPDNKVVNALQVRGTVALADGEIETVDTGKARYAKVQDGHRVEFKDGKLEGVYQFGGGEPGQPAVQLLPFPVQDEGQPANGEAPAEAAPPWLHPFPDPGVLQPFPQGQLQPFPIPPGIWQLGAGEVGEGEKFSPDQPRDESGRFGSGGGGEGEGGGEGRSKVLESSPSGRLSAPGNLFGKGESGWIGPTHEGERTVFANSRKTNRSYKLGDVNIKTGKISNVPDAPWRNGRDNASDAEIVVDAIAEGKSAEYEGAVGEKVGKRLRTEKLGRLQELKQNLEDAVKWLTELVGWASYADDESQPTLLEFFKQSDCGFAVKEVHGQPWLFTWSANAFKDREGEIFSTKSLESWAAEVSKRDDKGGFNFWHIPGSDFAKKSWVGVPGRILVEAGPFLPDAKGQAARKFFSQYPDRHPTISPEGWGCSVEYRYLPEERKAKVYDNVEITRTSVLPRFAAANTWTAVKEVTDMAVTDAQKKAAEELFGKALADSILQDAEQKTKELEPNVAHKAAGEEAQAEPPAAEDEVKAEVEVKAETEADKAKKPPADEEADAALDEEKPKKEKKSLDQFVKAIRDVAASVKDDSAGRTAILEVADNLSEENMKDMAKDLKKAGRAVKDTAQKERLATLCEALAGDGKYPSPTEEYPYPKAKMVEEIAAELVKQFKLDLTPIGEALTQTAEALKALELRVAGLEKQDALKSKTELPRFVMSMVKQASQAAETVVPEGDALSKMKPKESPVNADGSMAAAFFPTKK